MYKMVSKFIVFGSFTDSVTNKNNNALTFRDLSNNGVYCKDTAEHEEGINCNWGRVDPSG